jgi:hypothetical protein
MNYNLSEFNNNPGGNIGCSVLYDFGNDSNGIKECNTEDTKNPPKFDKNTVKDFVANTEYMSEFISYKDINNGNICKTNLLLEKNNLTSLSTEVKILNSNGDTIYLNPTRDENPECHIPTDEEIDNIVMSNPDSRTPVGESPEQKEANARSQAMQEAHNGRVITNKNKPLLPQSYNQCIITSNDGNGNISTRITNEICPIGGTSTQQCVKLTYNGNNIIRDIIDGECVPEDIPSLSYKQCISVNNDGNGNVTTTTVPNECPAQFTNVKSERKSRKIERFESNNNLKCKARY